MKSFLLLTLLLVLTSCSFSSPLEVTRPILAKKNWSYEAIDTIRAKLFTSRKLLLAAVEKTEEIVAIDKGTGELRWSYNPPLDFVWGQATVAISEKHKRFVLLLSDGRLLSLNLKTGRAAWSFSTAGGFKLIRQRAGRLLALSSLGALYAIEWKKGRVLWSYRPDPGDLVTSVAEAPRAPIILLTKGKKIRLLNEQNGHQLWESEAIDGLVETEPLSYGNRLIVNSATRGLIAFALNTGEEAWTFVLEDELLRPPSKSGAKVIICQKNGSLTALSLGLGDLLWQKKGTTEKAPKISEAFVSSRMACLYRPGDDTIITFATHDGSLLFQEKARFKGTKIQVLFRECLVLHFGGEKQTSLPCIVGRHGQSGKVVWLSRMKKSPNSWPIWEKSTLWVAADDKIWSIRCNPPEWSTIWNRKN